MKNDNYRKPYFIESLTDKQLMDLSNYDVPFSQAGEDAILTKFNQKRKDIEQVDTARGGTRTRKSYQRIVFVGIAAVLLVLGFTYYNQIQAALEKIFGVSGGDLAQFGRELNQIDEHNGIVLEALYALQDGEEAYLVFTLEDTQGGLLFEDVNLLGCAWIGEHMVGPEMISFQKESGKATFVLRYPINLAKETHHLTIENVYSGLQKISRIYNGFSLYDTIQQYPGEFLLGEADYMEESNIIPFEDRKYLQNARLGIPFESLKGVSLNAVGYEDGEAKLLLEMENPEDQSLSFIMLSLKHKNTGEVIMASMGGDYNKYIEYSLPVNSLDALKDYDILIEADEYTSVVYGQWAAIYSLPEPMEYVTIGTNKELTVNGMAYEVLKVTATPISLQLHTQDTDGQLRHSVEQITFYSQPELFTVTHRDGRKVVYHSSISNGTAQGDYFWEFRGNDLFDPENIAEITIGGSTITIH